MTINEYQKLAMTTLNPALDRKDVLINGVMGLCGEAGEAIDIVKRHLAQGHDLDREKLIKELGDVAWYLAETAYALDVPLEEVLQRNIDKLKARYPQGFEARRSMFRDEDMNIERAKPADEEEIYSLYRSLIGMPGGTWSEEYPDRELVREDLKINDVYVMRCGGKIAAAIVCEDTDEFEGMAAWYPDVTRWAQLSRLGVARDMQARGIAGKMLEYAMEQAKANGCQAVRFLVSKGNGIAQRAYSRFEFEVCGEAEAWDECWLCYQKRL